MTTNQEDGNIAAVRLRLPQLWPSDPLLWFAQVEAQFATAKITGQLTKFHHIIAVLSPEIATEVRDLILAPPPQNPYDTLKAELANIGLRDDKGLTRSRCIEGPAPIDKRGITAPSSVVEKPRIPAKSSVGVPACLITANIGLRDDKGLTRSRCIEGPAPIDKRGITAPSSVVEKPRIPAKSSVGVPACLITVLQWLLHLVRPWPPLGRLPLLSGTVRFILDLASKCERQHLHTPWKRLPLLAAFSEWSADHYGSLRSSSTRVCQGKPAGVSSRGVWWENSPYHTSSGSRGHGGQLWDLYSVIPGGDAPSGGKFMTSDKEALVG
ncbi:hypothetical protein ISCGN_016828 [Ixodes scapularis]